MSRTRVYESSKHRFFDNLVVLLAIVDSLAVNLHLQLRDDLGKSGDITPISAWADLHSYDLAKRFK